MLSSRWILAVLVGMWTLVPSLSHADEPGQLPRFAIPKRYNVRLEAAPERKQVTGNQTIAIEVREATAEIHLNAVDLTITKAQLRDRPGAIETAVNPSTQVLTLKFPEPLAPGSYELELGWTFELNDRAQGLFVARHQTPDGEAVSLATQMEPADARRMMPCWDEPRFRAEFQLTVVVPAKCQAISNMPAEKDSLLPDGQREVVFAATPSMPSYLLALFIGEYEELTDEVDGVKLRALTTPGKKEQARYALEATKLLLPWFNEYFGVKYPLPKLDQISIPGAPAAGMENWGAILYNDTAFLYDPATSSQRTKEAVFGVVAHELAHQWFGNLVTMEWWDNLWLNEGFASWIGTKSTAHFNPTWEIWLRAAGAKERAMSLDARATTHPIQQPVADASKALDAFDAITYSKGQSFLRMLEQFLGEDQFRKGLQAYMRKHAYGNTTTKDLWDALGEASGQPVADIASGWTTQPGFPVVKVSTKRREGLTAFAFKQERFVVHQAKPEALTWKIPLSYSEETSWKQSDVPVESDTVKPAGIHSLLLGDQPAAVAHRGIVAIKANVDGAGYYRVQYDEALYADLVAKVGLLSADDRLNLLQDTWALVQADRTAPKDWLTLVEKLATSDTSFVVWDAIVNQLGYVDDLQRGESSRDAFRKWAIRLVGPQLERIGWDPKPNETELEALLRASVVSALGQWGSEPVIAEAKTRFEKFVQSPESLPGNLRAPVLGIIGRNTDSATYETLHRLAKREQSTEQKRTLYGAMTKARSPELAQRTLALSLTDELLPREATRLVQDVGADGEHPALAWEFTRTNLEVLLGKVSSLGANEFVPGVFRGFSEEERAAELEAFSKTNLPPQAEYAVQKAADNIRFKAAFKKRLLPELTRILATAGGDAGIAPKAE